MIHREDRTFNMAETHGKVWILPPFPLYPPWKEDREGRGCCLLLQATECFR